MIRTLFFVGLVGVLCSACSSDSAATEGAGGNGSGSCPDLSGAWKISEHCASSLVGATVQVTQDFCTLSFGAPFDGFSGSVTAAGNIRVSGVQSCTGTATASAISMSCTPDTPSPCLVELTR